VGRLNAWQPILGVNDHHQPGERMNVEKHALLNLLSGDQQFEVPLYQRPYSWTDADRRQLWTDVLRAATTSSAS
jgi:Protein of unknown function DUF262